ncbi:lysozyme inhibitor LprI family protein [Cronobacter dublinensis]|uniref:lysozyme inhibitor LprI family protein n=1 Tax=Cronobacter dublinensis TaxID=413497 RepID=UPI0024AECB39|nr:lysozyme inhibitor LprI family protein [Cronobacter dublinensis]MDI7504973.1 lysozyme inhibitor LprI family protein [Cronobacter dublinensis]
MAYKLSIFLSCLLLSASYVFAAPIIDGKEVVTCAKHVSDYAAGTRCLEKQRQQTEQVLQQTLEATLKRVQSEDWLLTNMDYEDENSQIVEDTANALKNDQTTWEKHKTLFCRVASSQISSKAPVYPTSVTQCEINMNKARIDELKALMAQVQP